MSRTVSVVVCAYTTDRLELLHRCLARAQAQSPPPTEVIVVVDHSPELMAAMSHYSGVRVVSNEERQGLSGARNTGTRVACGDIIVFLDDDAEPRQGWLSELLEPFGETSVVGVGGAAVPRWESARPAWFPP